MSVSVSISVGWKERRERETDEKFFFVVKEISKKRYEKS